MATSLEPATGSNLHDDGRRQVGQNLWSHSYQSSNLAGTPYAEDELPVWAPVELNEWETKKVGDVQDGELRGGSSS